jgi:hypothetical protein
MPNHANDKSQTTKQVDADYTHYHARLDVPRCMFAARNDCGKGYLSQITEIWTLARGTGHLTAQDYFYYQLCDDSRYSQEDKCRFLSERIHWPLAEKCCDVRWWATADDKLLAQTILEHAGAPLPVVQAVYATNRRHHGPLRSCRSTDQLVDFLAGDAQYPLFAKPIGGIASLGAFSVNGFDASSKVLALVGGENLALDEFVRHIDHGDGYIFQSRLYPHADLQAICGDTVSTVRVILIIEEDQPEIIETVWKIPTGTNVADNFWRAGNMLAAVDVDTGQVQRVIRGYGPNLEELDDHPDSGKPLKGLVLPNWDDLRTLCLEFAMVFERLRYQSWDIAICPDGPVVVEVNAGSAFNLSQLATGRGILTDRFRAFLERCGYFDKPSKTAKK